MPAKKNERTSSSMGWFQKQKGINGGFTPFIPNNPISQIKLLNIIKVFIPLNG